MSNGVRIQANVKLNVSVSVCTERTEKKLDPAFVAVKTEILCC